MTSIVKYVTYFHMYNTYMALSGLKYISIYWQSMIQGSYAVLRQLLFNKNIDTFIICHNIKYCGYSLEVVINNNVILWIPYFL